MMCLFGIFNMYAQRVNLYVALVAMVHQNSTSGTQDLNKTCPADDGHASLSLTSFSNTSKVLEKPAGEFED